MAMKPKLELLHSNLAVAVTYAIDLQHNAVDVMLTAQEAIKAGRIPSAVVVELGHFECLQQLASAYLALWFETVEGKGLNAEHLLDYWHNVATTEGAEPERLEFINRNYTEFMKAHRSAHGTSRKT